MVETEQTFRVLIGDGLRQFEEISVLIDMPEVPVSLLPCIIPSTGGFMVRFTPNTSGTYKVRILLNHKNITGSPFPVEVLPMPVIEETLSSSISPPLPTSQNSNEIYTTAEDSNSALGSLQVAPPPAFDTEKASLIQAIGSGLDPVNYVHQIAQFYIDVTALCPETLLGDDYNICSMQNRPTAANGQIRVIIEGPGETKIHCCDNQDGSISVSYLPTSIGIYYLSVKYNHQHIARSPFVLSIIEPVEVEKYRAARLTPMATPSPLPPPPSMSIEDNLNSIPIIPLPPPLLPPTPLDTDSWQQMTLKETNEEYFRER